jgi:hypothetical protein
VSLFNVFVAGLVCAAGVLALMKRQFIIAVVDFALMIINLIVAVWIR